MVRTLPPDHVTQLIDFAYFLTFLTHETLAQEPWEVNEEAANEVAVAEALRASEEKWDRLLTQPPANQLLRQMALQALEEHRAGRTLDIILTDDGRLAPG